MVEVTEENLRHYYVELNTPLKVMPEIFGMPMGTLRKHLKKHSVEKTQTQAGSNVSKSQKANGKSHLHKLHQDKEFMIEVRAKGVKSRRANRIEALAAEGKSYEEVYKVFITHNTSIIKTGEHFGLNKGSMRSILKFYGITKAPELIQECKDAGNAELYADEDRVIEMVKKTQATIAERYGNNWYRNTTSKEEEAVRLQIVERFPSLDLIHGRYGIIRRPGSGGLMQLDFYFPEINLAVEYNGIRYHDKDAYLQDLENGTEFSREALKDRLCREASIELIHIWSDDWKKNIPESFENLAKEITAAIESNQDSLELAA
jgi:hypothetical protein